MLYESQDIDIRIDKQLAFIYQQRHRFYLTYFDSWTGRLLVSAISFLYCAILLILYSSISHKNFLSDWLGVTIVLTLLPLAKHRRYVPRYLWTTATATLYQLCMFSLKNITSDDAVVAFWCMILIFRLCVEKTTADNLAILILHFSARWTNRIELSYLLAVAFVFGFFMAFRMKELFDDVWELNMLVLIKRERFKRDIQVMEKLSRGCGGPVSEFEPSVDTSSQTASKTKSKPHRKTTNSVTLDGAMDCGVVPNAEHAYDMLINMQRNIDAVLRRAPVAIIVIKLAVNPTSECQLQMARNFVVLDELDVLASGTAVKPVRRSADTWIGCVGQMHSSFSNSPSAIDCFTAVTFASRAICAARKYGYSLCCAVGYGTVTTGCIRSCRYDMFGEEVRWALNIVELRCKRKIAVSDTVRGLLTKPREPLSANSASIRFELHYVDAIILSNEREKVYFAVMADGSGFEKLLDDQNMQNCTFGAIPIWDDHIIVRDSERNEQPRRAQAIADSLQRHLSASGFTGFRSYLDLLRFLGLGSSTTQRLGQPHLQDILILGDDLFDVWMSEPNLLEEMHSEFLAALDEVLFNRLLKGWFRSMLLWLPQQTISLWGTHMPKQYVVDDGDEEDDSTAIGPSKGRSAHDSSLAALPTALAPVIAKKSAKRRNNRNNRVVPIEIVEAVAQDVDVDMSGALSSRVDSFAGSSDHTSNDIANSATAASVLMEVSSDNNVTSFDNDLAQSESFNNGPATNSDFEVPSSDTFPILKPPSLKSIPLNAFIASSYSYLNTNNSLDVETLAVNHSCTNYQAYVVSQSTTLMVPHILMLGVSIVCVCNIAQFAWQPEVFGLCCVFFWVIPFILIERGAYLVKYALLLILQVTIIYSFSTLPTDALGAAKITVASEHLTHYQLFVGMYFIQFMNYDDFSYPRCVVYSIILILVFAVHQLVFGGDSMKIGSQIYTLFVLFLLLVRWVWYILFVYQMSLATELVPYVRKIHDNLLATNRNIVAGLLQYGPLTESTQLYTCKRYKNATIVAVHVKAVEVIPSFLDGNEILDFLNVIYKLIDSCFVDSGLLIVSVFAGVYYGVSCDDTAWDDIGSLSKPINYSSRAILLLNMVQRRVDAYFKDNKIKISVGVGLCHGSVMLGLMGRNQLSFDLMGSSRDVAMVMAANNSHGIYASSFFSSMIVRKGRFVSNRRVTISYLGCEQVWYRLDGSFNGIQISDFEYICMLAKGGYGSVHLMQEKSSGSRYAIKKLPFLGETSNMIKREFLILQQMQHPNVVNFLYCMMNKNSIYLVMTYVNGGNLKQIMDRYSLDIAVFRSWFAELVLALEYVHSLGIIHRDVKPANCMIGSDGHLKLVDFGLSKFVSPITAGLGRKRLEQNGTLSCMQLLQKLIPLKADIMIGAELTGDLPPVNVLLIESKQSATDDETNFLLQNSYLFQVSRLQSDGKSVQEIVAEIPENIHLILVDIDFTDQELMDISIILTNANIALLDYLCRQSTLEFVPIVAITHADDIRIHRRCIDAGVVEILMKPVHRSDENKLLQLGRVYQMQQGSPVPNRDYNHETASNVTRKNMDRSSDGINNDVEGAGPVENDIMVPTLVEEIPSIVVEETKDVAKDQAQPGSEYSGSISGSEASQPRDDSDDEISDAETINETRHDNIFHSAVGTVHYLAPEVIIDRRYGESVDWWACGVTFYECIQKAHLFNGTDRQSIMQSIVTGPIFLDSLMDCDMDLYRLVSGLVVRDPARRLALKSIKSHPFFRKISWKRVSTQEPKFKPAQMPINRHGDSQRSAFFGLNATVGFDSKRFGHGNNSGGAHNSGTIHRNKKHSSKRNRNQSSTNPFRDFIMKSHERKIWIAAGLPAENATLAEADT